MSVAVFTVIGVSLIFVATTLGAALVFFFTSAISDSLNALFVGFAAGIMTAASVWSLLIPAIESSATFGSLSFIPAATGFIVGGVFLAAVDRVSLKINANSSEKNMRGMSLSKPIKMFIAMTVHNVPEGLAVGFAFGAAANSGGYEAGLSALGLAVGIAIQNFPEGVAVSLPLKKATGSNLKAFAFGTLSGAVEPVAATLGYFLASTLIKVQPWLLAFAAGAMMFVVAEDLIPDSKNENGFKIGTWGVMIGFVIMMALDVALS